MSKIKFRLIGGLTLKAFSVLFVFYCNDYFFHFQVKREFIQKIMWLIMWWTIDFHFEATIPIIIRPRFTIFDHQKRQFQGPVVPYEKNRDQIVHFTRLEIHIQVRKCFFLNFYSNFDNCKFFQRYLVKLVDFKHVCKLQSTKVNLVLEN